MLYRGYVSDGNVNYYDERLYPLSFRNPMKLILYSDLHQEWGDFLPPAEARKADLIILSGDTEPGLAGLCWAERTFPGQPVVYVAGNHEYYGHSLNLIQEMRSSHWKEQGIHFLEQDVLHHPEVRVLGATLWSSFTLYGEGTQQALAMKAAKEGINDYWEIRQTDGGARLTPEDSLAIHEATVAWLDRTLAEPFEGKTVVVTHFPPHRNCMRPEHEGSPLSAYYINDLAWLMEKHPIDLWCHGHTHSNTDFVTKQGCRIISNQRGYPGQHTGDKGGERNGTPLRHPFRLNLLIEI